jgi:hypothetical protein
MTSNNDQDVMLYNAQSKVEHLDVSLLHFNHKVVVWRFPQRFRCTYSAVASSKQASKCLTCDHMQIKKLHNRVIVYGLPCYFCTELLRFFMLFQVQEYTSSRKIRVTGIFIVTGQTNKVSSIKIVPVYSYVPPNYELHYCCH